MLLWESGKKCKSTPDSLIIWNALCTKNKFRWRQFSVLFKNQEKYVSTIGMFAGFSNWNVERTVRYSKPNNLRKRQKCSERWILDFNEQKCAVFHLRLINYLGVDSMKTNYLTSTQIPIEPSQKDLGVWIQNNPKPPLLCVKAANNVMGVLHASKRVLVAFDKNLR
uniref:Uncharacterized protein n=1 Tax=Schistocephalus solidus TaxID=70667 RepID=A0A0X3P011_SCHSO